MHSVNPNSVFWRKSSHSAADGDCVEVARLANGYIGVRDSKNTLMPALNFTPALWRAFVEELKVPDATVTSPAAAPNRLAQSLAA